jgi:hypothetical protein
MKKIPQKYRLLFSEGPNWVEDRLHQYANKVSKKDALFVSKKLHKEILQVNKEIVEFGMPPHLQLCYVNAKVQTGVFLKYDSKPISTGDVIGIYTGRYELVPADLATHNAYAYDVAQEITLKQNQLEHVARWESKPTVKEEYSVQTNALEIGNFTRFINHSSLHPNIEAVVCRLPEGRMEVVLFALEDIEPGQQLLSCYGGQYWKALGIIPDDMAPDTYLLDNPYKAHKVHPVPLFSASFKEKLSSLRNTDLEVSDKVERSKILEQFIESIPTIPSKKHKEKIEKWEDSVIERGLPREYDFSRGKIRVNKAFKKGDFVGILSGMLSLEKRDKGDILLASNSKTTLFLSQKEGGNCLQKLSRDAIRGNVKLYPLYDEDEDTIYLVLLATRNLLPQEELILRI